VRDHADDNRFEEDGSGSLSCGDPRHHVRCNAVKTSDGNTGKRKHGLRFDFGDATHRTRTLLLACILFWSVLTYLFLTRLVFMYTVVDGRSMEPSLRDGDRCFVQRWIYRLRAPERGEIVAVQLPYYDDLTVKRVIALPYERVQIIGGIVLVNDKPLDEPYLARHMKTVAGPLGNGIFRVEHDCYFILGDNRPLSVDSRSFGAVHKDCILGRVDE
jgi:signal peptidase I